MTNCFQAQIQAAKIKSNLELRIFTHSFRITLFWLEVSRKYRNYLVFYSFLYGNLAAPWWISWSWVQLSPPPNPFSFCASSQPPSGNHSAFCCGTLGSIAKYIAFQLNHCKMHDDSWHHCQCLSLALTWFKACQHWYNYRTSPFSQHCHTFRSALTTIICIFWHCCRW